MSQNADQNEDKAKTKDQVDVSQSDVNLSYKQNNQQGQFEISVQKAPHHNKLKGKPLKTKDDKYNKAKRVKNDEGEEAIKTAREQYAKKKDEPAGIASADVGSESILKSLNQTDPQRQSQVLPQMYDQFGSILGVLSLAGSQQKGQNQSNYIPYSNTEVIRTTSNTISNTTSNTIIAAPYGLINRDSLTIKPFYEDLSAATKQLLTYTLFYLFADYDARIGYDKTLEFMKSPITNVLLVNGKAVDTWSILNSDYQEAYSDALLLLYTNVATYGDRKIPLLQPLISKIDIKTMPKTETSVLKIPKYSIELFYGPDYIDPYPGYTQFKTPSGTIIYVMRQSGFPKFYTIEESIIYKAWNALLPNISLYYPKKLTMDIFNELLNATVQLIEDFSSDYYLGYGTSLDRKIKEQEDVKEILYYIDNPDANTPYQPSNNGGGGGGSKNQLAQLLPLLQQMMQKASQEHLPNSVLEKQKMKQLLNNMEKKKTENKKMANFADTAVGGGSGKSPLNSFFGGNPQQLLSSISKAPKQSSGGGSSQNSGQTTTSNNLVTTITYANTNI